MADKRISQLIERVDIANNDVLPIVASGATTTNKVTISTIQTWMQDNLDVGVTSVGITIGSTGTDVSVSGSPVTSSGNITINIPTASATNRGLLSSANWTTFNNKLSSVGLTMPSAFTVSNSPLTANGTIAVTGAGTVAQYIRGDGSLADFPEGGGGGSAVNYYLNGSVSQGTIGGIGYYEMNKVPVLGAGTDFVAIADGYLASFITDAGDPGFLEIPAGNWNFETYFSASSGGGSPSFYIELYKVNSGGTATLIASNSATPELISFGTSISPYFSPLAVPTTVLTVTDRLAVRYYVTHSGRTITLHTENSHLCQVITTFTTGLTALNGLTAQVQNFATGTSGTDFNISSTSATHTFNLPDASASNRGAVTTGAQTIAGNKTTTSNINVNGVYVGRGASGGDLFAGIAGNTSVGSSALISITTGFPNTALGSEALRNITTGANNIAIGSEAGKIDAGSSTANATSSSSIYIGDNTKPQTNGNTNEIVIGHAASGNGSNTVTIGNSSTTFNKFFGATQSDTFRLPSDGGGNQVTVFENIGTIHQGTASLNNFGFNSSNNIYFGKGLSDGGVLTWSNSEVRSYTLPNVSGIIALTTNLTDFVTLSTVQTITAQKTFSNSGAGIGVEVTNSGSGDGLKITHSAGRAFNIQSSGAGFGVIINNETASTSAPFTIQKQGTTKVAFTDAGAADFSSSVTASSFVKSSGTSSQFLKADGSVDSSTYLTTGTAASTYLPLAGGTLTGALNGTSASFSSTISTTGSGYFISSTSLAMQLNGSVANDFQLNGGGAFRVVNQAYNSVLLNIENTGAATFSNNVSIYRNVDATATTLTIENATNNYNSQINFKSIYGGSTAKSFLVGSNINSGGGSWEVYDATESATRMVISSTGNVGIGTASPSNKLVVEGYGTANSIMTQPVATFVGGNGWNLGSDGTNALIGVTNSGTDMVFLKRVAGVYSEAMRITSGGNVLVGTSTANVNLNGIQVNSASGTNFISVNTSTSGIAMRFYTGTSVQAGYIAVDGSTTSYVTSSDYRLKENVKPVENALSTLEKLKPCTFNFISEPEKEVVGFLAHEVQEVIPQAIHGEKDAVTIEQVEVFPAELDEEGNVITEAVIEEKEVPVYQGIDHSKLVPLLVAAIQEQQEQIKSLTEQVEALKSQING